MYFIPAVSPVVKRIVIGEGVRGLIPGLVRLDTVLPRTRHRCSVSVLAGYGDVEMGPVTHYMLRLNTVSIMKV